MLIKRNKHYLLKYKDAKGDITERFIYVMFSNRHSDRITAYCYLRDAKRDFIVDRMISLNKVKIGVDVL